MVRFAIDHQQLTISGDRHSPWRIINCQPFYDFVCIVCFSGYLPDAFLLKVTDVKTIFLLTGSNVNQITDLICFYFRLKTKRISILKNVNSAYTVFCKHVTFMTEYIYITTQFSHSQYLSIFWHRDSLSEVDYNRTHD